MRVEILFRPDALARRGYSLDHAIQVVRRAFSQYGLECTVQPGGLTAYGSGSDDFSSLWRVLMALLRSGWFPDCAGQCLWYDGDGTAEDVLSQLWKIGL